MALAAVPLTNWPGAIALSSAVAAYALTIAAGKGRLRRWIRMLGMGALAYALAVPWMPPSTILNTQAAVQASTRPTNSIRTTLFIWRRWRR